MDARATLDRTNSPEGRVFHDVVTGPDPVLAYGGGDPVVSAYRALGVQTCVPINNALDPDTYLPEAGDPRLAADLAFLGKPAARPRGARACQTVTADRSIRVEQVLEGHLRREVA